MTQEETKNFLAECDALIKSCHELDKELEEMKRCKEFLINEYHTNKRWFKTEGGRVTVEDVIKSAFEFGWSSRRNFDYKNGTETH